MVWMALLNRIAEGDVDACSTFYDETSGLAFSLMMHILQNREAAEAALLDLYLQVWTRARLRAHQRQNPMTWLIGLARTIAVARLPRHRRPANPNGLGTFTHLTDEQRTILQMTYFGGLSAREAAEALGLPVHDVIREIRMAMETLREMNPPRATLR